MNLIRGTFLEVPIDTRTSVVVEAHSGASEGLIDGVHSKCPLKELYWQLERAVRIARLHEATAPREDAVAIKLKLLDRLRDARCDTLPADLQLDALGRALELAVVLADRLARQVLAPMAASRGRVRVLGQFEDPQLRRGDLRGVELGAGTDERARRACWSLGDGEDQPLAPLWSAGRPEVGHAEALFPVLVRDGPPMLRSVEVFVRPAPAQLGETHVVGPEVDDVFSRTVKKLIHIGRSVGEEPTQAWRTTVVFRGVDPFGPSWGLALAMADRIARGVEWPMGSGGRLIATGIVNTVEHPGAVKEVELRLSAGGETKLSLLQGDDVLLLPASMKTDADVQTLLQQEKPPTVLFLDHIVPASLRAASPPP